MIPYQHSTQPTISPDSVKIIGLGGAGANMLERIALDGMQGYSLLAINTDVRTLNASMAREKIQLGYNLTKGLGCGGDPELGSQAVLEAEVEIREALKGCRIVFVCAGLGGGTGSGAAPIVTRLAREEGAFVVVFATMPFSFEGKRRRDQAETALNQLAVLSNALVTFDNNRMGELVLAKQGIHEAFAAADQMICESIKAVIRLVVRPGLIHMGLDDLMSALRTTRSRCLFGSGIANGKDRAPKALRHALSSPLLDQGALLKEAQTVIVHLCGGEDLTLFEIELLMQGLHKLIPEQAQVLFGAAVDPSMGDALSVTLISALPEGSLKTSGEELPVAKDVQITPFFDPSQGFTLDEKPNEEVVTEEVLDESFQEIPTAENPIIEELPSPPEPETKDLLDFELPEELSTIDEAVQSKIEVEERPFAEPESEPEPRAEPKFEPTSLAIDAFDKNEVLASLVPDGFKPAGKDLPPKRGSVLQLGKTSTGEKAAEDAPPAPKLRLGVKANAAQSELSLDVAPRGKFDGEQPNFFDGEDLDLPPFLRKKK